MTCPEYAIFPANDLQSPSGQADSDGDGGQTPRVGVEACGIKSGPPPCGKQSFASKQQQLADIVESSLIDIGHVQTPPQQEELCGILLELTQFADHSLRRRLAEKLAPRGWASVELVWLLASDNIFIADDVIRLSPVLSDEQLVEITMDRTPEHRLAIARREGIGASVCRALWDSGEPGAILEMLSNPSAQIPDSVIRKAATKKGGDRQVRNALLLRTDLPASACRTLLVDLAQSTSKSDNGPGSASADRLRPILLTMAAGLKEGAPVDVMAQLIQTVRDNPSLALGLMEAGETELFTAMLSRTCNLPKRQIELIVASRNVEALGVICRSIGFGSDEFVSLVHLVLAGDGRRRLSVIDELVQNYAAICPERASEALQRWIRTPAD